MRRLNRGHIINWIILGIVILLILWQSFLLVQNTVLDAFTRGTELIGKDRVYRSAIYEGGKEFAEFMSFLGENVPPSPQVRVVLPPHRLGSRYTFISYMQYFLFPRKIDNCHDPLDECVLNHTSNIAYILAVPKFPPAEVTSTFKDFVPFRPPLGVYIPMPAGEMDESQGP